MQSTTFWSLLGGVAPLISGKKKLVGVGISQLWGFRYLQFPRWTILSIVGNIKISYYCRYQLFIILLYQFVAINNNVQPSNKKQYYEPEVHPQVHTIQPMTRRLISHPCLRSGRRLHSLALGEPDRTFQGLPQNQRREIPPFQKEK